MQQNNDGHPYVEKIREETQAYVRKLIGSEQFGIYERQPGSGHFQLIASVGMPEGVQLNTQAGSAGWVVEHGQTYSGGSDECDLVACVPLKLDGRVTGLIVIHRL